jgi:hypothetical protein
VKPSLWEIHHEDAAARTPFTKSSSGESPEIAESRSPRISDEHARM